MSSIFNKLKEGVEQVTTGVQEKLHESQLRGQLKVIEREKADQIAALGSAIYAMHKAGEINVEALHGQLQAIDEMDNRIAEKQKEIDEFVAANQGSPPSTPAGAAPERHCECGAVLSPAAKFCPECGKANPVEPV